MANGKVMIIHLIVGMIKKYNINESIFPKTETFRSKCES